MTPGSIWIEVGKGGIYRFLPVWIKSWSLMCESDTTPWPPQRHICQSGQIQTHNSSLQTCPSHLINCTAFYIYGSIFECIWMYFYCCVFYCMIFSGMLHFNCFCKATSSVVKGALTNKMYYYYFYYEEEEPGDEQWKKHPCNYTEWAMKEEMIKIDLWGQ